MTGKERIAARLLSFGVPVGGVCLIVANIDSLIGDGGAARIIRLVAGLILLFEGLALTLDGSRPWTPPGRRLVKAYMMERVYGVDGKSGPATITGKLLAGTMRGVLGSVLFIFGLVLVGFGVLELTRVP